MKYDECLGILSQFRDRCQWVVRAQGVHAIQVALVNEEKREFALQIATEDAKRARLLENVPSRFRYEFGGITEEIETQLIEEPMDSFEACQVEAGQSAFGGIYLGTVGWNVLRYPGLEHIALSCWHVLCGKGNDTPLGYPVSLGGSTDAKLWDFVPTFPARAINNWDVAMAEYDRVDDMCRAFKACQAGNVPQQYPYPKYIAEEIFFGDEYYKVGASSDCTTGKLRAVRNHKTTVFGSEYFFDGQLRFDRMTMPGDSGAILVHTKSNMVTGLHMSGSDAGSTSNPFYLFGWIYVGSMRFAGSEHETPVYMMPNARDREEAEHPEDDYTKNEKESGGLLYLGFRTRSYHRSTERGYGPWKRDTPGDYDNNTVAPATTTRFGEPVRVALHTTESNNSKVERFIFFGR